MRAPLRTTVSVVFLTSIASAQAVVLEDRKLQATGGATLDAFGRDVSVVGDLALITAFADDDRGSATFFEKVGGTWVEGQRVESSTPSIAERFGISGVLIGDTAFIGAESNDDLVNGAGAVYVFEEIAGSWSETTRLYASDPEENDGFGYRLDGEGDLLIAGAPAKDEGAQDAGAAYVFRRNGTAWTEEQKLTGVPGFLAGFGGAVSTDGDVIAIGAASEDGVANNTGAVYVFRHDGVAWQQEALLTASDALEEDYFGFSVAIEGDVLAVGAYQQALNDTGAMYVFRRNGTTWTEEQKLIPLTPSSEEWLGFSMEIDAGRIVAGAVGSGHGAAYHFQHDGTHWVQVHKWKSSEGSGGFLNANVGFSLALDGSTFMTGAPFGLGSAPNSGCVYVYEATPLALDVAPDSPFAGLTATFRTGGGLTGAAAALYIVEVDGVPMQRRVRDGGFDVNGEYELAAPIPAVLSGVSMTFATAGFVAPGVIGWSNQVTVPFQ